MPKPLDAGGIGPALVAGTLIGKVAAEAVEARQLRLERLLFLHSHNLLQYYIIKLYPKNFR